MNNHADTSHTKQTMESWSDSWSEIKPEPDESKKYSLRLTIIDWGYPKEKVIPASVIWVPVKGSSLLVLYLEFANGVINELKAEAETAAGIDLVRGLAMGAGGAHKINLSEEEKKKLWLYEEGYECYLQGKDGYIFINPELVKF
jgi:hypothetical protein